MVSAAIGCSTSIADERETKELQKLFNIARPSAAAFEVGQVLGGYRLVREIGAGGMANVWLAERADGVPKRQVALKLPRDVATSADAERFARERDVLAALVHSNIASLYDAGVVEPKQPFIAMEYIDGVPITEYCDQHGLTIPERLQLFLQVLAAVEHAHKHLVVHRDLKPSNVFVNAEGKAKLLDFGIAKLIPNALSPTTSPDLTQKESFVLTPRYAAPEQCIVGGSISTATDIYVAGLLLYELLCGTPAHLVDSQSESISEIVDSVLHQEIKGPSHAPLTLAAVRKRGVESAGQLRSKLVGDLDNIVGKALKKPPADRYASIERFANDVRRFLANEPISARAPSPLYAARLFLKRNRGVSIAVCIGMVASLAVGILAMRQYQDAQAHAARTTAIRNFIFDLVNDAEPDEADPDAEVTGKQMVDAAVRRTQREFAAEPRMQGELLGELGRMYSRLGAPASSRQLLADALTLLEQHAPRDDPALNKTRAHLADALLSDGKSDQAGALATSARADCASADAECAKARAYANIVISKIALNQGQTQVAIDAMRTAVVETARGFGADHPETAITNISLAIVERNAGHLREANAALERAQQIAGRHSLRAADRVLLYRTVGMMDIDLGRYEAARTRLTDLAGQTSDPYERAIQLRLLAHALLLQGEPGAAADAADRAMRDATTAGDAVEVLNNRQIRAGSMALLRRFDEASTEIEAVISGLRDAGIADNARPLVRARRMQAEILARAGRYKAAHAILQELVTIPTEQAEAFELMGCVQRATGRPAAALEAHASARAKFREKLPDDHPWLLRNTLYEKAARFDLSAGPAAQAEFSAAASSMTRELSESSVWRAQIDACVARLPCPLIL